MLVLAIPALSLETGDGALRQFPEGNETREGAELAARQAGPGAAGPAQVLVDSGDRGTLARVTAQARRDPEAAAVSRPELSRDGRSALFTVEPRHDPESPQARAMVDRLGQIQVGDADVRVGGATASVEDFKNLVSGSMWKILLFVLAFSYLVLLVLLRSVLLPLKAVLMNLLSVGAAYGVLVAVFQWGWLDGFAGFQSLGYVNTMTPPLLLAIVFGLSMDYEVFLLSRIRERYDATGDTRRSVAAGPGRQRGHHLQRRADHGRRVRRRSPAPACRRSRRSASGLAVAIALDATIVRLILVPATMEIMGRWNWWLPRPLDRVLPHTDFEAPQPT